MIGNKAQNLSINQMVYIFMGLIVFVAILFFMNPSGISGPIDSIISKITGIDMNKHSSDYGDVGKIKSGNGIEFKVDLGENELWRFRTINYVDNNEFYNCRVKFIEEDGGFRGDEEVFMQGEPGDIINSSKGESFSSSLGKCEEHCKEGKDECGCDVADMEFSLKTFDEIECDGKCGLAGISVGGNVLKKPMGDIICNKDKWVQCNNDHTGEKVDVDKDGKNDYECILDKSHGRFIWDLISG